MRLQNIKLSAYIPVHAFIVATLTQRPVNCSLVHYRKMKCALSWIVFAGLVAAVLGATCPATNDFTAEFALIADAIVPESLTGFDPTTGLPFLRNIMLFDGEEIAQVTQDAIEFFNTRFGLDFSQATPDENGQRILADIGATFTIFEFSSEFNYHLTVNRWAITGNTRSSCFVNRDGGFAVEFQQSLTLNGTYGGQDGRPVVPGDFVLYGFYNIPVCPQSPLIIRYMSGSPIRTGPVDGFGIINCDLFNREIGAGVAQGVFRVTDVGNDEVHFAIRNLLTFPANPGLSQRTNA